MGHVIELDEAVWFQRCRRAWDLGAGERRNLEALEPLRPFDLAVALREGLGAWYFPAMWAWTRSMVRPIALESFHKSMRTQRASFLESHDAAAFPEDDWAGAGRRGSELLEGYFDWASNLDDFTAVRVSPEIDVVVPDPGLAGAGLIAADGGPIRFRGRIDLLVADEHNRLWLVEHRLVDGEWPARDTLVLDPRSTLACWALEHQYDARIGGVLINELRPEPVSPTPGRSGFGEPRRGVIVIEDPSGRFRRTRIRKTLTELRRLLRQFAAAAAEMTDPGLPVYPNPSPQTCARCAFVAPCLALSAGDDPAPVLEASYRRRVPEVIPLPPRTGSCGPQRVYGWKTKGPGVSQPI